MTFKFLCYELKNVKLLCTGTDHRDEPELVIVNVSGAQESISRNRFRQLMEPIGPECQQGCRTGPPGWESIPRLLKRSTNTGSGWKWFHSIGLNGEAWRFLTNSPVLHPVRAHSSLPAPPCSIIGNYVRNRQLRTKSPENQSTSAGKV